jgi:hypothetical protein
VGVERITDKSVRMSLSSLAFTLTQMCVSMYREIQLIPSSKGSVHEVTDVTWSPISLNACPFSLTHSHELIKLKCYLMGANKHFRGARKIAKSDVLIRHVCLSVRMEQLGSHSADFHEI